MQYPDVTNRGLADRRAVDGVLIVVDRHLNLAAMQRGGPVCVQDVYLLLDVPEVVGELQRVTAMLVASA